MSLPIGGESVRLPAEPVVTVAIPAFNASRYLGETVDAVRNQTFPDWELVVVDNASTDETGAMLDRLLVEAADPRIRVFRNPRTVTPPENWNIAISHSRGRYLKLVCADDIPTPDCLERQVAALDSNPSASLASGARVIINSRGVRLFTRNGFGRTGLYPGRDVIRRCIMAGTNIIGDPVHVMWRRSSMEQVGAFDPAAVYCPDVDYWLRFLGHGDLYYDTCPVGAFRIHRKAATTGLAHVAVEDFVRMADKQAKLGAVRLSSCDYRIVRLKSRLQGWARQAIYRWLG